MFLPPTSAAVAGAVPVPAPCIHRGRAPVAHAADRLPGDGDTLAARTRRPYPSDFAWYGGNSFRTSIAMNVFRVDPLGCAVGRLSAGHVPPLLQSAEQLQLPAACGFGVSEPDKLAPIAALPRLFRSIHI